MKDSRILSRSDFPFARKVSLLVLVAGVLSGVLLAVSGSKPEDKQPTRATLGDPERGLRLMAQFECGRCHDASFLPPPSPGRHCTGCHQKIMRGAFDAPPEDLRHFQGNIRHFIQVPSLDNVAARFRQGWLVEFLKNPHDLRPDLAETMPRLPLAGQDALDIASYLAPERGAEELSSVGDVERGRALFSERACSSCHAFSGVVARAERTRSELARVLAPDLIVTRARFRLENLVRWLRAPEQLSPGTLMPNHRLSESQAADLAAFVVHSVAQKFAPPQTEPRDVSVAREVFFDEVNEKVFRKTCWHCHSDPDFSQGDEGPGNEGGFGFAGVGLNLGSYEGVLGGAFEGGASVLDRLPADRERTTVVDIDAPEQSRLVRALRARRVEEGGGVVLGVRGMPLALPALEEEEIALVEAWISQGARF